MKKWTKRTIVFLLVLIIGMMGVVGCSKEKNINNQAENFQNNQMDADLETQKDVAEDTVKGLEFPVFLDQEKLKVNSSFQLEGINPDCGNAEGTDIASIVLENVSDDYLVKADIWLGFSDGSKIKYTVSDLPSGKTAMAFSVDNSSITSDLKCTDVACEADYREMPVEENEVLIEVDGIEIKVTNTSSETISKVVLYCHNLLDEEYFGGTSYSYTISDLKANETVTVQALDCILGMAEVVFVEIE